jgi:hypothetical protein
MEATENEQETINHEDEGISDYFIQEEGEKPSTIHENLIQNESMLHRSLPKFFHHFIPSSGKLKIRNLKRKHFITIHLFFYQIH